MIVSCAALAACNQTPVNAPKSDEPPTGRWQIVAAPEGAEVFGTVVGLPPSKHAAVWRLDTQSGALEFCYEDGGVKCGIADRPQT
jgi:hypothetical protein